MQQTETRNATTKEAHRHADYRGATTQDEKEKLHTFHSRLKDCQTLADDLQGAGEKDMGRMTYEALSWGLWLTEQRIGMERHTL